ncbi:MAG: GPP34 family phosphoprotein [Mycobacterium sp.]|nr:GPP34 family phosphoprotein [Mycobacterium sp.]
MARIAEDLLLLLLDNPSAQPHLDRSSLGRTLAAALILDLAYDGRVRPAMPGEPIAPGHLVALSGPVPMDPAVRPTLALLAVAPLTPAAAIAKLRKRSEDDVLDQLLRTGQLHQIQLSSHRLRRNTYKWPVNNPTRVAQARKALQDTLLGQHVADPVTAIISGLLLRVDGLAALNLDPVALQHAQARAREVSAGGWADRSKTTEVNLEVTAAAVLPALG